MKVPDSYWHRANLALLAMVLIGGAGALGLALAAYAAVGRAAGGEVGQLTLWMGAVAGVLLILVLGALAALIIRYISLRATLRRRRQEPTEVVDAWKLAGQRAEVPEDLDPTEPPKDWKDPDDWPDRPRGDK